MIINYKKFNKYKELKMSFKLMKNRSLEIDRLVMMGLIAEILYQLTNMKAYRWFAIIICIISAIILLLFIFSVIAKFVIEKS